MLHCFHVRITILGLILLIICKQLLAFYATVHAVGGQEKPFMDRYRISKQSRSDQKCHESASKKKMLANGILLDFLSLFERTAKYMLYEWVARSKNKAKPASAKTIRVHHARI